MSWSLTWWTTWEEAWAGECVALWRDVLAAAGAPCPFQRPALVRAWAETRGREIGARPMLGLATDALGTRVLLPWVVSRQSGRYVARQVLEPAGQALFAYHALPSALPPAGRPDWPDLWQAARRGLARRCDQARLRFVPAEQATGPLSERCGDASPLLDLSAVTEIDQLLASASAKLRTDLRRQRRRLEREGSVELWVPGPEEAGAAAADFRRGFLPSYHALWGRHEDGRYAEADLLAQPGTSELLGRLVAEGLPGGWAHYAVLRVGGEPIAWHLGLFEAGELYWWFPAYAPAWAAFSPGKVLLAELLAHGVRRGWRRLHFLTGGQAYKLAWRPGMADLRTVRWYSPTSRGRILSLYDRARHGC